MVKADPRSDYYADLECKPSADTAEIKRQFKKLALKYHPDRNPGKELEFNSKFQAIQSAHEILTDPQQRAKYDVDRIRSGAHHSFASPARPNPPPRAPASTFPPPPQRAPPTATKANAPPPTPSGANKYKKYSKPEGGGGPYRSSADDTTARANAFKAWEQMRHGQAPAQKGRPVPPRSPKTTAFPPAHEAGSYPPRESSHKTPWDQPKGSQPAFPGLSRSNTTRIPKKGGFSPGTLGGDEPPARNTSAYYNAGHGDRPDNSKPNSRPTHAEFRAPPPPGQRGPSQTRPDPLRQFKVQVGQDDPVSNSERISTPYATAGGEKTYFSSSPFQTSSKARDKANQNDVYDSEPQSANTSRSRDSSGNHQRGHHSASPRMKSPLERAASEETVSSSSTDDSLRDDVENLYASAKHTQESRAQDRDRLAGHRQTRFQPSVRVEDEEETIILPWSQSDAANGPKSPGRQSRSTDQSFGKADKRHQEGFMEHRIKREEERVHQGVPNLPSPNTAYASLGQNGQQRPPHRPILRPRSWHEKYGAAERSSKQADFSRPMSKGHQEKTSIFNVPLSATERKPDHPPPLRSHSSETINYNFSPSDWEGKFTGNGNSGYPIPPRKQPSSTKARTSPTKHQVPLPPRVHQPSGSKGVESPNAIQKPTIQADQSVPVSRQEDYSPEKWESCFKPGALNFPPPPPPFGSPRAMSRKRSKAPKGPTRSVYKRPTVPKSATVSATADDAADSTSSNLDSASSKTSGDDSAMDIDSLPTPPSGEKPSGGDEQRPATQETPKAAPRPPVPPRPSTQPHDSSVEKPHLSMGDFKNVAPFAPSQEGIRDLNDLANALPFESRPSARAAKPPLPQQLELPPVPKAPAIPENLTQNSWERYIAQMRAYMYEWNAYNTKMLAHFNERQASVDAALQPDWMTAIGEGTDKWGYAKYMQGIEEDFRVRGYWDVSWEKHRECIRGLGAVRERLLGTSIKTSV